MTQRQEFKLFATVTCLNQQTQEVQAATFLIVIGQDARKTYSTFVLEKGEEKSDIGVLKKELVASCKPSLNLAYHEYRFEIRHQHDGESFNDWLTELRVLAKSCEFGEMEERMLQGIIIHGVNDKKLQERLILENTNFAKTVEISRTREHDREQCEAIQAGANGRANINAISEKEMKRCGRCARKHETQRRCEDAQMPGERTHMKQVWPNK